MSRVEHEFRTDILNNILNLSQLDGDMSWLVKMYIMNNHDKTPDFTTENHQ